MSEWLQKIESNILDRKLIRRGERLLLGISGGLDSMVLLHLLHELAAKHRWKLAVAHFNHKLRGRSSDADERLVRKVAAALKLPAFVESADVKSFAKNEKLSVEMAARQLRHEFFVRAAKKNKSATVALAHHADDQVELFFLRLLRGSGSEGLSGMNWRSRSPADSNFEIIRPLLDQSKAVLEAYAGENKILFREDASNAQLDFQRNRIRHELVPTLKKYQPALHETVLRTMDIVRSEANFVFRAAVDWIINEKPPFEQLHAAVQRRCLELYLRADGFSPSFDLIEHLRIKPAVPIAVSPDKLLFRTTEGHLGFLGSEAKESRTIDNAQLTSRLLDEKRIQFGGRAIRWSIQSRRGMAFERQKNCEFFDADKIGRNIALRHWLPGDRFQPIGLEKPVKLQDLFVNAKIPRAERHKKVIAVAGKTGEIFWVEGLRISERFKLEKATTRRLQWRWKYI